MSGWTRSSRRSGLRSSRSTMPISESAFAKINLSLQIVGRRHDGYHLLDSLVAFADLGDTLDIEPAEKLSLITCGRYSAALPDDPDDNLVLRAARWLNGSSGAKMTLHKELPIASGMGGGSADAAAAIRGLARMWDVPVPPAIETERLGADVPVCVGSVTARVRGVGEQVEPVTCLPPLPVVLVNPGRQVSTGRVFTEYGPVDSRGSELVIPTRGLNVPSGNRVAFRSHERFGGGRRPAGTVDCRGHAGVAGERCGRRSNDGFGGDLFRDLREPSRSENREVRDCSMSG